MNVRQRVIETLNHREPDVLVIDFGGMRSTGISAIAYNKLKEYLGLAGGATRLYDVFQQLAEPEPEILAKLGGDFVQLHRYAPAFGIRIDRWKPGRLPDGSACLAPEGYDPITNERGELEIRDGDVVVGRMPAGGLYFDQVLHPYAGITTKPQIDRLCLQEITAAELAHLEREAKCLHETTDKAILGAFGGNILEAGQTSWGYERFMTALALEPDLVHYWLEKLTETYMRDLEKYLGAVGRYLNVIQFGDDLGTQEAPQISRRMYQEMIMPYHRRQYQYVRAQYPHVKVFLHSCGAVFDLIPDLIEAGVEVLNPVQISARGMDPRRLKWEFGRDLVFWGGGADMQRTVPAATTPEIEAHVRELVEIFAPGGGYVFSQVHNIQADVPPEKILAIYRTAMSCGGRI